MAEYTLKYYKEIPQAGGLVIRLDIYRKSQTTDVPSVPIPIDGDASLNPEYAPTQEIGAVIRGLHLNIQGETGEVDTPIVKTSLTIYVEGKISGSDILISGKKTQNKWDR